MSSTGSLTFLGRLNGTLSLGQHTLSAGFAAVVLSVFDVLSGVGMSPNPLPFARGLVVWFASTATLLAFSLLFLGPRAIAHSLAERARTVALLGALDGAALGYFVIVRQPYASLQLSSTLRWSAWMAVVIVAGSLHLVSRKLPITTWFGAAASTMVTVLAMNALGFRDLVFLRLALTLTLLACMARLTAPFMPHVRGSSQTTLVAMALSLLPPLPILRSSEAARSFLFQFSGQAGTVLRTTLRAHKGLLSDRKTAHRSEPCEAKRKPKRASLPSPLSGSAQGADVLILSMDALRWDHAFAAGELFDALGPHVRFLRAITPAPNTKHALPAVMRGVPAREVPFSADVLEQGVRAGAPPTLATMLSQHGYRAVQIPTQRFFDPRVGLTTGFEIVRASDTALFAGDPPPRTVTSLRAKPVLSKALSVARKTQQPLLLWTHLMESHAPYRHGRTSGPHTSAGQREAIAAVAKEMAAFLPRYRKARKGRPLIVLVFGDHGEEFGEHGGSEHGGTAYAELARVGFVMAAPSLPAARVEAPVSTSAGVATVLDLLGLDIPPSVSIPSLLPCIAEPHACPELAETQQMKDDGWVSYTGPRYRLVYGPRIDVRMAFDSLQDPYDRKDLFLSEGALPDELKSLEQSVLRYDREHCAAAPLPTD